MIASEGNVFWLGGSPCSGKSSISEILADRFDLDVYHVDEAFKTHAQRLDPVHQPTLAKWRESSWNEATSFAEVAFVAGQVRRIIAASNRDELSSQSAKLQTCHGLLHQ